MQKWKAKLVAAIKRERRFPGLQQRPGFGLMSFEVIWSRGRKNGFLGRRNKMSSCHNDIFD